MSLIVPRMPGCLKTNFTINCHTIFQKGVTWASDFPSFHGLSAISSLFESIIQLYMIHSLIYFTECCLYLVTLVEGVEQEVVQLVSLWGEMTGSGMGVGTPGPVLPDDPHLRVAPTVGLSGSRREVQCSNIQMCPEEITEVSCQFSGTDKGAIWWPFKNSFRLAQLWVPNIFVPRHTKSDVVLCYTLRTFECLSVCTSALRFRALNLVPFDLFSSNFA